MSSGTREAEQAPEDRQSVMALCAQALAEELREALEAVGYAGVVRDLRRPETGLVMVRGRAGGDGRRFNLGEATVTRAAVSLEKVGTGFAYRLGRDAARARLAATLDALWQSPRHQAAVSASLAPVRRRLREERARAARQAAATRVDFFTVARGEDA